MTTLLPYGGYVKQHIDFLEQHKAISVQDFQFVEQHKRFVEELSYYLNQHKHFVKLHIGFVA